VAHVYGGKWHIIYVLVAKSQNAAVGAFNFHFEGMEPDRTLSNMFPTEEPGGFDEGMIEIPDKEEWIRQGRPTQ